MESFCPNCGSGRRSMLVSNPDDHKYAEELIECCFNNGSQYKIIVLLLKKYDKIPISIKTLKKVGTKKASTTKKAPTIYLNE